jgi:hypothetical protein
MSRVIDSALESNIEGLSKLVTLIKMKYKGSANDYLRLTSASIDIEWDEDGLGKETYKGIGDLGTINSAEEGTELQAYSITFTITGIDPDYLVDAVNQDYKNEPLFIYLAPIKSDNTVDYTTNEEDGPVLLFVGRMDTMNIELGDTGTISVTAVSKLSDWERPRGGKYTHHTQKMYYAFLHNGTGVLSNFANLDRGFEHVDALKDKEVNWGGQTTTIGQGTRSSGGGGRDRGSGGATQRER